MPNYDGTGPFGDGRPGRGWGPCSRFGIPARGFTGRGFRRWFGRGYRFRGGYGARFYQDWDTPRYDGQDGLYPYTKEDLQARKEDLEKQLQWLNDQLAKG